MRQLSHGQWHPNILAGCADHFRTLSLAVEFGAEVVAISVFGLVELLPGYLPLLGCLSVLARPSTF